MPQMQKLEMKQGLPTKQSLQENLKATEYSWHLPVIANFAIEQNYGKLFQIQYHSLVLGYSNISNFGSVGYKVRWIN